MININKLLDIMIIYSYIKYIYTSIERIIQNEEMEK